MKLITLKVDDRLKAGDGKKTLPPYLKVNGFPVLLVNHPQPAVLLPTQAGYRIMTKDQFIKVLNDSPEGSLDLPKYLQIMTQVSRFWSPSTDETVTTAYSVPDVGTYLQTYRRVKESLDRQKLKTFCKMMVEYAPESVQRQYLDLPTSIPLLTATLLEHGLPEVRQTILNHRIGFALDAMQHLTPGTQWQVFLQCKVANATRKRSNAKHPRKSYDQTYQRNLKAMDRLVHKGHPETHKRLIVMAQGKAPQGYFPEGKNHVLLSLVKHTTVEVKEFLIESLTRTGVVTAANYQIVGRVLEGIGDKPCAAEFRILSRVLGLKGVNLLSKAAALKVARIRPSAGDVKQYNLYQAVNILRNAPTQSDNDFNREMLQDMEKSLKNCRHQR